MGIFLAETFRYFDFYYLNGWGFANVDSFLVFEILYSDVKSVHWQM